jgi:hypothetical protein
MQERRTGESEIDILPKLTSFPVRCRLATFIHPPRQEKTMEQADRVDLLVSGCLSAQRS